MLVGRVRTTLILFNIHPKPITVIEFCFFFFVAPDDSLRVGPGGRLCDSDDEERPADRSFVLSSGGESDEDSQRVNTQDSDCVLADDSEEIVESDHEEDEPWGSSLLSEEVITDQSIGPKVTLLLSIIKESQKVGDKVYVKVSVVHFGRTNDVSRIHFFLPL